MLKKFILTFLLVIVFHQICDPDAFSEIWLRTSTAKEGIMSALPAEYRGYSFAYACDYAALRDVLIPGMGVGAEFVNGGIALAIGYITSCAAAGLVATLPVSGAAAGATTVIAGKSRWDVAIAAARSSSQASWFAAEGAFIAQNIIGTDISTWLVGATAADYQKQCDRLKTELGISDYFAFACLGKSPSVWSRGMTSGEELLNLPLGAQVVISVLPSTMDRNAPPPLVVVKEPRVSFSKLGSSLQEYSLTGQPRPVTVPFVFAYEKFKGQMIRRQDGNNSVKIGVAKGNGLGGRVTGDANLSLIPQLGFGGLRELHLSSPINMGLLFKNYNDDFALTLVVNNNTVAVRGPVYPAPLGSNLRIAVLIKGFHDNRHEVQGINGRVYPWKSIADGVLSRFSCQGAGIASTLAQDMGDHGELWCKPTKPGKVSIVAITMDGNVIFPDVATVGSSPIEGLWKLRGNGSEIRIVYVPNTNTFRGILEVDHLQHIDAGDIIWDPIKSDPTKPDVYSAIEHMSDGHGSMTSTIVTLQTRNGILIYQDGPEIRYLDPVPGKDPVQEPAKSND
jgi:hypothetical protein